MVITELVAQLNIQDFLNSNVLLITQKLKQYINYVPVIGLAFDILGAFFLAKGFLFKNKKELMKESGTYYNGNPFLRNSFIIQKLEVWTGFIFIAIGFFIQIYYYFLLYGLSYKILITILFGCIIIGFIISKVLSLLHKKEIRKVDITVLDEDIESTEIKFPEQLHDKMESWGEKLKIPRIENEPNANYLQRIKNHVKVLPKYPRETLWEEGKED